MEGVRAHREFGLPRSHSHGVRTRVGGVLNLYLEPCELVVHELLGLEFSEVVRSGIAGCEGRTDVDCGLSLASEGRL